MELKWGIVLARWMVGRSRRLSLSLCLSVVKFGLVLNTSMILGTCGFVGGAPNLPLGRIAKEHELYMPMDLCIIMLATKQARVSFIKYSMAGAIE